MSCFFPASCWMVAFEGGAWVQAVSGMLVHATTRDVLAQAGAGAGAGLGALAEKGKGISETPGAAKQDRLPPAA